MGLLRGSLMNRSQGRPKQQKSTEQPATSRLTIINLKGSKEQAEWIEAVHRKTHIPKSVIIRLALNLWAEQNNHPPFPSLEKEE